MTAGVWNVRDFRPICAGDVDHSGFEVMGPDGSIGVVDSVTNKASASYLVVDTGDWPQAQDHRRINPCC
jgi:hypothetical protein